MGKAIEAYNVLNRSGSFGCMGDYLPDLCYCLRNWASKNCEIGFCHRLAVELHLPRLKEVYAITLPTLYWRSLLSQPYIELNGRVTVTCGDVVAPIIFHPKVGSDDNHWRVYGIGTSLRLQRMTEEDAAAKLLIYFLLNLVSRGAWSYATWGIKCMCSSSKKVVANYKVEISQNCFN